MALGSSASARIGLVVFTCLVYSCSPDITLRQRRKVMLQKMTALLFMVLLVFSTSTPGGAQATAKRTRVEGQVVRRNKDKSTLDVRVRDIESEKTGPSGTSTKWTTQSHREKNVQAT